MRTREERVRLAALLNFGFTLLELVGGLLTNSLALLADALHDLGDSIALFISWLAERKARKPADTRHTYGFYRLSLLSSIFAALVLIAGSLFILSEAIPRLFEPEPVLAEGVLALAVLGVVINGYGYVRLREGMSQNEKVLSWHLLEDALGWVALLVGSAAMTVWKLYIIDPLLTVGFTMLVLVGVVRNLGEVYDILLEGVPPHIDVEKVREVILSVEGVREVHDLHIWSLEGETDLLTAHIVLEEGYEGKREEVRRKIKERLRELHIEHVTVEIEGRRCGEECPFRGGGSRGE